jgi:CIC family chloride channel protein
MDAGRSASADPPPMASVVKVSHNVALAIGDTIREDQVDLLVLGWRGGTKRRDYFFGSVLDNTVTNAECDVVMMVRPAATFLKKAKRILVPVLIDYQSAQLSLQIALALGSYSGLPIESLHVSEKHEAETEEVRASFQAAAEELSHAVDLSEVKQKIVHARNVYGTLLTEIRPSDVIVVEGRPEKILSRTFFGEIPERLAQELENHVILTKSYPGHVIGWFQKLFGTREPEPYSSEDGQDHGA